MGLLPILDESIVLEEVNLNNVKQREDWMDKMKEGWLDREIRALLPDDGGNESYEDNMNLIYNYVLGILKNLGNLNCDEAKVELRDFLGGYINKFAEEAMLYLRLPFHLGAYDKKVGYNDTGVAEIVVVEESPNSNSDVEVIELDDDRVTLKIDTDIKKTLKIVDKDIRKVVNEKKDTNTIKTSENEKEIIKQDIKYTKNRADSITSENENKDTDTIKTSENENKDTNTIKTSEKEIIKQDINENINEKRRYKRKKKKKIK